MRLGLRLPQQGRRIGGASIALLARILSFRFLSERRTLAARLLRRTRTRRRCRGRQPRRRRLARPRIGADVGAKRIAGAGAIAASARSVTPGARGVPGARSIPGPCSVPGALGGLGLDLAHGLFQRQPLTGDFGFAQRRLHAAQLRDQRSARPLVERAAALSGGTGVQSGDGAGDERVVISHVYSIFRAFRVVTLSLERVLDQNSIFAFGAGGKQSDWAAHQFLDPTDIFDGLRRQVRPGAAIGGRLLPPLYSLVDRLNSGLRALAGRQMVDFLAVQGIAGADLDRIEAIENVELGQRQPVDAAGPHRLAHQHGVEPAAAPLAPGIGAELAAALADPAAGLVVLFGRERALPDAGRIGLADAEHAPDRARAPAGA